MDCRDLAILFDESFLSNEAICKERTFFISYGTTRNLSKRIITSLSALLTGMLLSSLPLHYVMPHIGPIAKLYSRK